MGDTDPRARSYVHLLQEEDKVTLKDKTRKSEYNIIYNNQRIYDSPISNCTRIIKGNPNRICYSQFNLRLPEYSGYNYILYLNYGNGVIITYIEFYITIFTKIIYILI